MTVELGLPFPLLSDSDCEGAIKPFGVWSEDEGIARPSVVALAPGGEEIFRHVGADYADRPVEDEVLDVLRPLGLASLEVTGGVHPYNPPEPSPRAIAAETLVPYFRGVRGAAKAVALRTDDDDARRIWSMAERFITALGATY